MLKNIFLVSYLKNKGIRRICFIIGVMPMVAFICFTLTGAFNRRYNHIYHNLHDLNFQLYLFRDKDHPEWYKRQECASVYFKKNYGLSRGVSYSLSQWPDILQSQYCKTLPEDCAVFEMVKNKPIHLQCNGFETPDISTLGWWCVFILLSGALLYLPFVLVVAIKLTWAMFCLTSKYFKENS